MAATVSGGVPGFSGASGSRGSSGSGSAADPSVPPQVVGVWCGGRNDAPEGHWTYAFTRDGRFAMQNARIGSLSGYVVASGHVMEFHSTGLKAPVASTWEVRADPVVGDMLFLDGFSYVRGSCTS
ncbi:hypothetical protein J1792_16400 [Streptomyces triculaminicus]|uniref:Uncharacterized protein n=2 Tax=Streptomyces TaxID=1883 RepID=A0A939JMK3_9ACTN|nr:MULTISPECIES: hypothetical protein [Streptomyces]MBO0654296.1 hypothetical protein [Streptomyces triculaminicus]QSY48936.1 hypothetical protein J3S04_28675 [Streptomyces griseocarneus]